LSESDDRRQYYGKAADMYGVLSRLPAFKQLSLQLTTCMRRMATMMIVWLKMPRDAVDASDGFES